MKTFTGKQEKIHEWPAKREIRESFLSCQFPIIWYIVVAITGSRVTILHLLHLH